MNVKDTLDVNDPYLLEKLDQYFNDAAKKSFKESIKYGSLFPKKVRSYLRSLIYPMYSEKYLDIRLNECDLLYDGSIHNKQKEMDKYITETEKTLESLHKLEMEGSKKIYAYSTYGMVINSIMVVLLFFALAYGGSAILRAAIA